MFNKKNQKDKLDSSSIFEKEDKEKHSYDLDLIIIGGGAGGFSAATRAGELGVKTLIVNAGLPIGGTCVNVGCVPSKILIEISNQYYYPQHSRYWSLKGVFDSKEKIDFESVIKEKDELISALRSSNYVEVLREFKNVTYVTGYASFVSPHEIRVNNKVFSSDKIIIATGSRPRIIPIKGLDKISYLTNREAFALKKLPKSIIVIGGGPIGVELGQMFRHFGSEVTIIERMDQLIPRFEPEQAEVLEKALISEGIEVHTDARIIKVKEENRLKKVIFRKNNSDKDHFVEAEEILIAVGVTPNTEKLELEKAGVKTDDKGFIVVDSYYKTSQSNIYAVGDVVGKAFLETVAAKEGYLATRNALEERKETINYNAIPYAIFTTPQIASVGLTEKQAKKSFEKIDSRVISLNNVPKAQAMKEKKGIFKIIIEKESETVLGVHIAAPLAADLIHEATIIVKKQMTIHEVIDTVHVFPTLSEGIKRAAQAFVRNIEKMSCCVV